MKIELKKFGDILTSRQDGREALAAIESQLQVVDKNEVIEINFGEVTTLTPSWADEFVTVLSNRFGEQIILTETENPSVTATLELLERLSKK